MNTAVGTVTRSFSASALVVVFAILLGTGRYESKVFERRLAEDEIVFAACGRSTGTVGLIVFDLCLLSHSSLDLRRAVDIGEIVATVLERGLKGNVVDNVSGRGVDRFGGSGDTTLMVCDRGLQGKEGGDPGDVGF